MTITKEKVSAIFRRVVGAAEKAFEVKHFSKSLSYIESAALWMYNFNISYSSYELEKLIHEISSRFLTKHVVPHLQSNHIAFIDNFGYDNRGLTQQYLRGLMAAGKKILYVLHNSSPNGNSEIIKELSEYGNCEILICKTTKNNRIQTASDISQRIAHFAPSNIFLHIAPWDVVSLLAVDAIEGPVKYNINLTDHAFWLGVSFVDYNIEFRGYGKMVSLQKRGFTDNQLVYLPYYPIVSKYAKFQGFPQLPNNSIIIFCGGSEYKMLGKDGIFFKLMDSLLSISQNVVILVAGVEKESTFASYVSQMNNKIRVYLIGNRTDINEVFAHSDIFLSSYPFIGGLMTQFAAKNSLPILAYSEPGEANVCDHLINHFDSSFQSKHSIEALVEYAKELIEDKKFRIAEGERNKRAMMDEDSFNTHLANLLDYHTTTINLQSEQPDYEDIISFYLDIENQKHTAIYGLFAGMKISTPLSALPFVANIMPVLAKRAYSKLTDRLKRICN